MSQSELEAWVEAVLREGNLTGSRQEEHTEIGHVLKLLKDQQVTGASLVELVAQDFLSVGIALGPAKLLASRIARLRAEVAVWQGPTPLVTSVGCDWDFQDNGIVGALKEHVPTHYKHWKAGDLDKTVHPLFIVLGAPGTSKSRTLHEIPTLMADMFDGDLGEKVRSAYVINITFENGCSDLVTPHPVNPSKEFGARLMKQLGISCPDPPTLKEALTELAHSEGKELRDLAIILTVDGMQGLPGDWKDTGSPFHRGMRAVADLVNGGVVPAFVIGAVSCSTMVPGEVSAMLATTRQQRVIITPKPLGPICRNRVEVFDEDLLPLIADMGGLAAALVALENAINRWKGICSEADEDKEAADLSTLFTMVRAEIVKQYPAFGRIPKEVIGAALTGIWLNPERPYKGSKPAQHCLCTLVTLQYREDGWVRFVVPYVLLALKGFMSYNFDDYREREENAKRFVTALHWTSFEEAVASFWNMKTQVLRPGRITLRELHHGATMTDATGSQPVLVKPLGIARSMVQISDLNCFTEFECRDTGKLLSAREFVVLNAAGASGPDVIQPLAVDAKTNLYAGGQMKFFSSLQVTQKEFDLEHQKANAQNHLFIVLTTGKAAKFELPHNTAIVDQTNFKTYFGPLAFRMFAAPIDLNCSSLVRLMHIQGVGRVTAQAIIDSRREGKYRVHADLARIRVHGKKLAANLQQRLAAFLPGSALRGR